MRLDALGLSVETVTKRAAELKAEGFTGDAFDQAVLEGLQDRMKVLGDVTETTAGQMQMLETDLANLKDEAKQAGIAFAGPFAGKVVNARDALELLNDMYDKGSISTSEYLLTQIKLRTPLTDTGDILEGLEVKQDAYNIMMERGYDISGRYTQAIEQSTAANWDNYYSFSQSTGVVDFYAKAAEEAARAANVAGGAIRDQKENVSNSTPYWETLNKELSIAGQAYSTISTNVSGASQAIQDQIDFLTSGGGAITAMIAAAKEAINKGDFGLAQKISDDIAIADVDMRLESGDIDATEAAAELVEQLGITPEEAAGIVAELEATLFAITAQTYVLKFDLEVNGQLPGLGQLPSTPVRRGSGSTGGVKDNEDMSSGQSFSGTGGSDIFIDSLIIIPPTDASMKNLIREAASSAAGSGYTG